MIAGEGQLTRLLQAWSQGDDNALDQLTPLIYGELRKLARLHMSREKPGHTLQPTALIHEAFLKLIAIKDGDWQSRKHFFSAASIIMRRLLVDYARKKRSFKRGGIAQRISLDEAGEKPADIPAAVDIIAFDEALNRLAAIDVRKAQVVQFWFFDGMTVEEIAAMMGIGTSTVQRDLEFAKVWLTRELGSIHL
ncbi:MAG TPA: sigma-70 family RNA polymerase sigma factor [Terriglobia bacterium]|nr:sigma-70 family RNA polymerase sigma factor [Terriglobia bacterium]